MKIAIYVSLFFVVWPSLILASDFDDDDAMSEIDYPDTPEASEEEEAEHRKTWHLFETFRQKKGLVDDDIIEAIFAEG